MNALARLLALAICLCAAVGIVLEFLNLREHGANSMAAAWSLALYFTILTNFALAVLFGLVAIAATKVSPKLLGGAVAAIVLVGLVYALLLRDVRVLGGATAVANLLLHQLNPVLAAVYWLVFVPRGRLSWRDPLTWSIYPLGYLAYVLWRGASEGRYPYPFIDAGHLSLPQLAANCLAIAAAFVMGGEAMVLLDRILKTGVGRR